MTNSRAPDRTVNRWWVAFVAGMASYVDSTAIVGSGTALVIYQHALGVTPGQVGVLSAALTLSIAAGALGGGRLGDMFGRKRVFMATMAIITAGSGLLVFSTSFPLLMAGTVLVGVGTGADLPVSLATISEAADDHNRGKLVTFSGILWGAGIGAATLLGMIVGNMGRPGGQILFGHVGVVALILLFLRLGIPESTRWHAAQHTRQDAPSEAAPKARLTELLRAPFAVPFVALLVFYALTNLAANTQGQFGTYVMVNVVGVTVSFASGLALAMMPLGLLWTLLFMRIVDGPHRMRWFVIGAVVGIAGILAPVVLGFSVATMLVALVGFGFFGAFSFEPIMKIWAQESFPTLLRSTAQGAIIAVARVLAAALASVTPLLLESSPQVMYLFLAAVMTAGVTAAYLGFRRGQRNQFGEESPVAPEGAAAAEPRWEG